MFREGQEPGAVEFFFVRWSSSRKGDFCDCMLDQLSSLETGVKTGIDDMIYRFFNGSLDRNALERLIVEELDRWKG